MSIHVNLHCDTGSTLKQNMTLELSNRSNYILFTQNIKEKPIKYIA